MDNNQSNKKRASSSSTSSFGDKRIKMDNENKNPDNPDDDDLFHLDPIPLTVSEDDDDPSVLHQLFLKLPKETRFEILSKLPIKSLCRFKCVSKIWLAMIQHPIFVDEAHLSKPPFEWAILDRPDRMLIVTAERNGQSETELTNNEVTPELNFRYCNGIMGFSACTPGSCSLSLCLCNITTGEIIELQSPTDKPSTNVYFELGFDPFLKKHIVLDGRRCQDSTLKFYVCTLEEGASRAKAAEEAEDSDVDENRPVMTWRQVESNVPQALRQWQSQEDDDDDDRPHFCCANGALFWFIGQERIMVSFNVANEQFRTVQLPQKLSDMVNEEEFAEFRYSLFEFEGHLCLVEQPSSDHNRCNLEIVNLWMLKDIENNVWVTMVKNKMLPLEDTNLRNYFLQVNFPYEARFLSQNGEILIAATDEERKYIFLYSFLNGQFLKIEIFGELGGIYHFRVNNYVENDLDLENCGIFVED